MFSLSTILIPNCYLFSKINAITVFEKISQNEPELIRRGMRVWMDASAFRLNRVIYNKVLLLLTWVFFLCHFVLDLWRHQLLQSFWWTEELSLGSSVLLSFFPWTSLQSLPQSSTRIGIERFNWLVMKITNLFLFWKKKTTLLLLNSVFFLFLFRDIYTKSSTKSNIPSSEEKRNN